LIQFPKFIRRVIVSGADLDVVIRLSTFHELNVIRVIFRFIFAVPFLILGADGIKGHHHVNESALWTDLLGSLGAIGCIISSLITIMVFFPRSIEKESGFASRQRSLNPSAYQRSQPYIPRYPRSQTYSEVVAPPTKYPAPSLSISDRRPATSSSSVWEGVKPEEYEPATPISPGGFSGLNSRRQSLHPMVLNFTSPIDLIDQWDEAVNAHQVPA